MGPVKNGDHRHRSPTWSTHVSAQLNCFQTDLSRIPPPKQFPFTHLHSSSLIFTPLPSNSDDLEALRKLSINHRPFRLVDRAATRPHTRPVRSIHRATDEN